MTRVALMFNGKVQIRLEPETTEDKQLLALCFGGRSVVEIKNDGDAIVLVLEKSEKKSEKTGE